MVKTSPFNAGGASSIPGHRAKSPHAWQPYLQFTLIHEPNIPGSYAI